MQETWGRLLRVSDAGGVQVGPHLEASAESEAGDAAAVRAEAAEAADQVPGTAVEEVQHEDHVCHLPESAPQAGRWLGLRQW